MCGTTLSDTMMTPRKRPRAAVGPVCELEPRCLLSGQAPTGIWLGQDGHDLTSQSALLGPDGVQDIHLALAGLPTDLAIVSADVRPQGGGEWLFNGPANGPWASALVRAPNAATADLYVDPYQVETGRTFWVTLTYADQSTAQFGILGGAADPALRMPSAAVQAGWYGQDGHDLTGPGPDVGPDGVQDVHLALAQLAANATVQAVTVSASSGAQWAFGLNPGLANNAELVANAADATRADLFFNPIGDLNGQTLTVNITYSNRTTDRAAVLAGPTDPALRAAAPAPVAVVWNGFGASWVGQDGQNLVGPGDVHAALTGLPLGRSLALAELSDEVKQTWSWSATGATDPLAPYSLPLALRTAPADPTRADIDFPPVRDESNSTLTLRLVLDDGTVLATQFAGGAADTGLRASGIASSTVIAHPGDDLNALANQYGTVHLTTGTYTLTQPLVLNQPVTITADPGVTLLFQQTPGAPPWTAAIKINASHTTLNGFAVRFAGPIQWAANIDYGPAVIGTTDNFDSGPNSLKVAVTLSNLDLQTPPPSRSWELVPDLIRLASAQGGSVVGNILKGGATEFLGGPWTITGNTYQGTVPDTYAFSAFSGHYTHDVTIANNQVAPVGASGKTWRFLVLTQSGVNDVVRNNTVVGIGPRDSDTVPNPNASEVLLTESYGLHFEGMPTGLSADGRVLTIPDPQGGPASAGDVVAVLSGPQAGQWRLIAQVLSPTSYLLDTPLSAGSSAVAITRGGFVNETYQGNTIDTRGSSSAFDIDLSGNQFGAQVLGNDLLGGAFAFQISAYATEFPDVWGWSHAPFLGAVIAGNVLHDALNGGGIDVAHGGSIKSNQGRTYLSASLTGNLVEWSAAFLAQWAQSGKAGYPLALTVGELLSVDPGELLLTASGNQAALASGSATIQVNSATVNGAALRNQALALSIAVPGAPSGLALVVDDGNSATDGVTSDGRLRVTLDPLAAGAESSLSGVEGTYQPVPNPAAFLPVGLSSGFNMVFVRAFNASGQRGPVEAIAFVLGPPPATSNPSAQGLRYAYRIGGTGAFVPLGQPTALNSTTLQNGPPSLEIQTVSPSGNLGAPTRVQPAPAATTGVLSPVVPPSKTKRAPRKVVGHSWHRSHLQAHVRPVVHPVRPLRNRGDQVVLRHRR